MNIPLYYDRFTTKVVQLLRVHIISSIGLPLRPTTFCTTLLSYLKCKIIGISEYDRNCCTSVQQFQQYALLS